MNQLSASPDYENPVLDRAARSDVWAFTESKGFLPHKDCVLRCPKDSSRNHALSDVMLQPWVILPNSIPSQQVRDDQTRQAVEDAIAAERNRLARELHDAVTQTLFAASLIAEVLPDLWEMDEAEAHRSTEELRQLTRGALAEMRTLLFELRPAALNQARLSDLLRQLSEAVMGRKRLPICLDVVGDCEIPCNIKVEMYRIVQESLNNVVKYARATRVEIKLQLEAGKVHLEIKDDGIGFDTTNVKATSMGLRIMRERAESIHAQLQVLSQPGMGTTVSLEWQA